jgi:hypothetical protein
VWIKIGTEVTTENQWKSRWMDAKVKNAELVVDPIQKLPGYDFSGENLENLDIRL